MKHIALMILGAFACLLLIQGVGTVKKLHVERNTLRVANAALSNEVAALQEVVRRDVDEVEKLKQQLANCVPMSMIHPIPVAAPSASPVPPTNVAATIVPPPPPFFMNPEYKRAQDIMMQQSALAFSNAMFHHQQKYGTNFPPVPFPQ